MARHHDATTLRLHNCSCNQINTVDVRCLHLCLHGRDDVLIAPVRRETCSMGTSGRALRRPALSPNSMSCSVECNFPSFSTMTTSIVSLGIPGVHASKSRFLLAWWRHASATDQPRTNIHTQNHLQLRQGCGLFEGPPLGQLDFLRAPGSAKRRSKAVRVAAVWLDARR